MYLRFSKIRDVKSPRRAHPTDAGIDFYVPNDFEQMVLCSNESILIPSGIKVEVPFGYAAIFMNKSGFASRNEILVGAQVIDTYYSGEVHIDLHNVGKTNILINPGDKVIQLIMFPIAQCGVMEVSEDKLYKDFEIEYRGSNGFGSTNKR